MCIIQLSWDKGWFLKIDVKLEQAHHKVITVLITDNDTSGKGAAVTTLT